MKIDKYKFQCKEFCIKCGHGTVFYKAGEKGKVYPVVCRKCQEIIKKTVKEMSKPHYWTTDG